MIMKIQAMICLWLWNVQVILCLHELQVYEGFKFSEKAIPYVYDLCQIRHLCYAMIHDIFTFMHLIVFTKSMIYVFQKKQISDD